VARGDWAGAIRDGEQAIAVHPDPGTLGLLRDAWVALGDTGQAASYGAAMMASALTQPGPIHRAWGLHLAEHGERLAEVTRRIRAELGVRRDVYGHDVEAWALYAAGKRAEAWRSARRAIAQNTEDAELLYRAGTIAEGVGEHATATQLLRRAHELRGLLTPSVMRRLDDRFGQLASR
jgi:hypothetical protein